MNNSNSGTPVPPTNSSAGRIFEGNGKEHRESIVDISDAGSVVTPNANPAPARNNFRNQNRPFSPNNGNKNRNSNNSWRGDNRKPRSQNGQPNSRPNNPAGQNAPVKFDAEINPDNYARQNRLASASVDPQAVQTDPSIQGSIQNAQANSSVSPNQPHRNPRPAKTNPGQPGQAPHAPKAATTGLKPRGKSKDRRPPRRTVMKPLTTAGENRVLHRANANTLRIIPLGGSDAIGDKNMLVYEYNNDIIIIDAGIKFPDDDMPGIDYVICDTTYLEENRDRVRAFIVTHGHEDHIGAFPYIWPKFPVPIYTAPLTAGFIKAKFEEHGITGYDFRIILPGQKFNIGAFQIEAVQMTHSIPDILGLAFTTPVGLVYHATDWKIDFTPSFGKPTDFAKLTELAERGILCLLSDSTGILQPGFTLSETVVSKSIDDIFAEIKGRIIVSAFSSRIDRIQHVINACAKTGRRLFFSGRSMERNTNIAMELGYLKVPQGVIGDINTINSLPDYKICVMSTGSQGEEGSALTRMASGEHRHVRIKKGDTIVLSSSIVPGNERAVDASINNLYRAGADVITNKDLDIHSSGHGSREEIRHMLNLLKPKYFIPIHGDYRRFVEQGKLAVETGVKPENVLIVENGQVAEFTEGGLGKISNERVPVGSVLIDGSGIGDVGEIVLRDRQTMAKDGVFLVILTVDGKSGKLMSSPDIISRGFVYMKESEELIAGARTLARKIQAHYAGQKQIAWDALKKDLRDQISNYLVDQTQRRPMVISAVISV